MAQADNWSTVGQLFGRDASGVSLHESSDSNSLPNCCSVAWNSQLLVFCGLCVVGHFWGGAHPGDEPEGPPGREEPFLRPPVGPVFRRVRPPVDPAPTAT